MDDTVRMVIESGRDKNGRPESFDTLSFTSGQVVAIVGPTGSGKTRLLSDLERLSPGDSPTGRKIRLTGVPDAVVDSGFAVGRISQTMQFFLDLSVNDFVVMHLDARGDGRKIQPDAVVAAANSLTGEPMSAGQPLAALSGGQARALMVADLVMVVDAPVLLIDEIENAGIDRHAAMDFLVKRNRLVFMATHDPLVALRAGTRIVLSEGGIRRVLTTSNTEVEVLGALEVADRRTSAMRELLRRGDPLA